MDEMVLANHAKMYNNNPKRKKGGMIYASIESM